MFEDADLEDAWIDGDENARWRSATGAVGERSGSSLLEVPPGCRLPRHTDSAEESVVILAGGADVDVSGTRQRAHAGDVVMIPPDAPHEVFNVSDEPLRFVALYASNDVTTRYEAPIQPAGEAERRPLG